MTPHIFTIRIYDPDEIEEVTDEQEEEIIELYLKNEESLREIGDRFDYAASTIIRILEKNNVEIMNTRIL